MGYLCVFFFFQINLKKFIELLRRGTIEDRESAINCLRTALAPCALDAYPVYTVTLRMHLFFFERGLLLHVFVAPKATIIQKRVAFPLICPYFRLKSSTRLKLLGLGLLYPYWMVSDDVTIPRLMVRIFLQRFFLGTYFIFSLDKSIEGIKSFYLFIMAFLNC